MDIEAMASRIQMIEDPRLLVDRLTKFDQNPQMNLPISLDAIFVPFRNRPTYVNALLRELVWYEGPIYLMPSSQSDLRFVSWIPMQHVERLNVEDLDFIRYFESLLTSSQGRTEQFASYWDLPLKRNYALWYSRIRKFRKILIVDDDMRGLSVSTLSIGSSCLDDYVLAGCLVTDFPDYSIVTHLEALYDKNIHPFLSGSFLFLRPNDSFNFFPKIYNEDWLFMIPYIIGRTICSFGSITQMPYDPFEDASKAAFQEFGDIIAEGLYALLNANQYAQRYESSIWDDIICERRQTLVSLTQNSTDSKHRQVLDIALRTNRTITPGHCLTFIEKWESDLVIWQSFVKET